MLTPVTQLIRPNADLLRALQRTRWTTNKALAADLGRDASNLGKSLAALHDGGLITEATCRAVLTEAGQTALEAFADTAGPDSDAPPAQAAPDGFAQLIWMQIDPDPLNPRKHFDEDAIDELADSIARDGLLENLVVRPGVVPAEPFLVDKAGKGLPMHRLVAGERRHRAIKRLIERGEWIPGAPIMCRVVDIDDAGHRRIALVENLQRKDLRPIDEANALKELMAVTGAGTAEVAETIGFTQRFVQQRLQLLELPDLLLNKINAGELTVERGREAAAIWKKLPPIKQVEVRDGKITVDAAKAWLDAQPEPLELTPEQLLVLLEVAWMIAPKSNGYWTTTPCDGRVSGLPRTLSPDLLYFSEDGYQTAKLCVRLSRLAYDHLVAASGGDGSLTRAGLEPLLRKARLGATRGANPLAEDYDPEAFKAVDALFREKRHLSAWLNPPFATDPALEAAHAERKAQRTATEAEWELRREREAAERTERATKLDAMAAEALVHARTFVGDEPEPDMVRIFAGCEAPLPWSYVAASDGWRAAVLDADGQDVDLSTYDAEGLLPLLVAAVNCAAGFAFQERPRSSATAEDGDETADDDADEEAAA